MALNVLCVLSVVVLVVFPIVVSRHPGSTIAHLAEFLGTAALIIACRVIVAVRAERRTGPPARWRHLLFFLGFLAAFIVSAAVGSWAQSDHIGGLNNAMIWAAGMCLGGMLMEIALGLSVGFSRLPFLRSPPRWLDQDGPRPPE